MAFSDIAAQESESPFTDDDRMMHTSKLAERTFGRSVDELGQVVMQDGRAVLQISHDGANHTLAWSRAPSGAIFWYLDGSAEPLALQGGDRAVTAVLKAIGASRSPAPAQTRRLRS
jgi:hypothetical protein